MSKILKNETASPINVVDTGVTIAASPGSYTIPPQDYLIWAASSDVITFIGSGDLVVNDGSFDLNINQGTDLILGIFNPNFTDETLTGSLTTAGTNLTFSFLSAISVTGINVTGTWSGELVFMVSIDGTNFEPGFALVYPSNNNTFVQSTTANGHWLLSCAGLRAIQVYVNSMASGTANIYLTANNTSQLNTIATVYQGGSFNTSDNIVDVGGDPISVGTGPSGSGIMRVTVSNDSNILVTQSTSPWVISGTVAATQSGTWNINNISGTISLPTGAATEITLAKLAVTQGSTTSGQSGTLTMGAVTTAAPSYTTAQTSPLSLTTAGLLRVDASGTTITGTVTANQGTSPWVVGQSTAANLNATVVGTGTFAVQAAQSGTWNITNITGTVSLPTGASTEATLSKLTLTQGSTTSGESGPLVQGAVTTSAPSYTTAQTSPLSLTTAGALRVDGSGSTQPISGTVTVTQGTAANLNATVVGTGTFAVQAAQSGTWNITNISGTISLPTGAATEATLAKLAVAQGSTTSGQSGTLTMGAVTTAAPSYTTAQTSPLSLTTGGLLRVDASGTTSTVTANQGTSPWVVNQTQIDGTAVSVNNGTADAGTQRVVIASDNTAFNVTANAGTNLNTSLLATDAHLIKLIIGAGSTTSSQSGPVVMGAVTTAAPSYSTAQVNWLSLNTSGGLRVDGSGSTQPVSGTVAVTQSTSPWVDNISQINGVTPLMGNGVTGTGSLRVTVASDNTAFAVNATLQTGANVIGALTANQSVNVAQINGVTPLMGNGTTGTGSQRVTIASDNTAFSVNANQVPSSSSANAPTRVSSSALEASHVIKASAGNLYTVTGYNSRTSSQFIQVFNSTTVPADTTVPIYTFIVAAQSNFSLDFGLLGENFSTGIAISNSSTVATKTIGSADCWFTVRYQ